MFRRKNKDEVLQFQVYDEEDLDYIHGEDINWDEFIEPTKKRYKNKNKTKTNEDFYMDIQYQQNKRTRTIHTGIVVFLFLYLIFVGGGYLLTTFDANNKPQIIDVNLREVRNSYYLAEKHYKGLLQIINLINKYDNELIQANFSNAFEYSIKYQKLTEYCDEGIKQVKGEEYKPDYVHLQLENAQIYDELKTYIQHMTLALSTGNQTEYNTALSYREKAFNHFAIYEKNIKAFKEYVKLYR